jgi:hypothetical protein
MEDFFAWCKKEKELVLPKSKYGDAINYALNLVMFFDIA